MLKDCVNHCCTRRTRFFGGIPLVGFLLFFRVVAAIKNMSGALHGDQLVRDLVPRQRRRHVGREGVGNVRVLSAVDEDGGWVVPTKNLIAHQKREPLKSKMPGRIALYRIFADHALRQVPVFLCKAV